MNRHQPPKGEQSMATTDAELVRAAQRGEKRAFVEIVARHQALVCGIALGILNDFAASEDAGQEAFLLAWRKIHDLREPERLRSWLCQIARNAALGILRARKPHDPLQDALPVVDGTPTPDEAAASEEEAALVRQSLAELPESYRLPLILFYREGQSVRAVAEALGLSEDAVKQRLARGREMCRERISGVIETVLTRTRPSAIFTMSIAVAIGALATPAAVAGAAFASGAALGTTVSTSSVKTVLLSMSASKVFLAVTALVAVVCVPIGYNLRTGADAPVDAPNVQTADSAAKPKGPASYEDSALFAEWRALHAKFGTNAQSMPALYNAITNLGDAFHRQALTAALIAEWAEVDPKGGLAFYMGKGHDDTQRQEFFRSWLARDPQGAVTALVNAGPGWEEVARECLTDVAKLAPNRVAEIASLLPKSDNYWDNNVRDAFSTLAESGLDAARKAAESTTGPNRDQALAGIAHFWGRTDLNAAVAWARGLPDGTDRNEIIRNALLGVAGTDPVAALEGVGLVPEGGRQAYFASTTGARVLAEAARTDFEATVAWLQNHPGRLGGEDLIGLSGVVTGKLNADPAGFLSEHMADGTLRVLRPAIDSALLNGSSGELGTVWDWLKTQPHNDQTEPLIQEVLNSAAWHDASLALQLAKEIPDTPEGNREMTNLANSLLNGGSMLKRFEQLQSEAPDRLQTPLLESAFNFLGRDNLADPQAWAARLQLLPEADRIHGTENLARAWAAQSPGDAITWANSLAQGEAQNGADAAIVTGWAGKDAHGAADWVSSLPPGPQRDQSAGALAGAIAEQFPSEAWQWATSISDPAQRDQAATRVITAMAGRDRATARQWIDAGPFSTETKLSLQAALQTPAKTP